MKRDIITISENRVAVTGSEVWMTATELAGLFGTTVGAVNGAIKAIIKSDVLNDYEVCMCVRLENGNSADVYSTRSTPGARQCRAARSAFWPTARRKGVCRPMCSAPTCMGCLTPAS